MSMLKRVSLFGCLWMLSGCISVSLLPTPGPLTETKLTGEGSDKVLIIDVSGLLASTSQGALIKRPSLPARIKEELTMAADDPQVKAVILRINSPGGTVTASDIIYHEIQVFKKKRKIPIITSIMDLGTSGGYYVALAGDHIVAHPSSVTGSLGVIMLTLNAAGLLEKVGVEATSITSGPHKDIGSPFRAMTTKEQAIFQSVIDSFYQRFLDVIQQGRPQLTMAAIRTHADGRIYSATQAYERGLIDQVGYLEDAIEQAKQKAGLKKAKVVVYNRPRDYKHNIYSEWSQISPTIEISSQIDAFTITRLLGGGPQFMYVWWP